MSENATATAPSLPSAPAAAPAAPAAPSGQAAPAAPGGNNLAERMFQTKEAPAAELDWHKFLPEDLKKNPALAGYKNDASGIQALFKTNLEAQAKIGAKGLIPPGKDATPEAKEAFQKDLRAALQVPESPDKYEFKNPQGFENAALDESLNKEFRTVAHKIGLSPEQAQALHEWSFHQAAAKQADMSDEDFNKATTQVWGNAAPERLAAAKSAFVSLVPKEYHEAIAKLPNQALLGIAHAFDAVKTKFMSEDTTVQNGNNPLGAARTPDEVRQEKMDLMYSPAYKDAMHPNHATTIAKVKQLNEQYVALTQRKK